MPVIRDRSEWPLITDEKNRQRGKLIKVEIAPGRFVKMYESDVKGLKKPPKNKKADPGQNKIKKPGGDKSAAQEQQAEQAEDSFAEIPGVGPATERALKERGILTFDDLREAGELDYLTAGINANIEKWRVSNG